MDNLKILQCITVLLAWLFSGNIALSQTLEGYAKQCSTSEVPSHNRTLVIDDKYLEMMFDKYFSWSKVSNKYAIKNETIVSSRHDSNYKMNVMTLEAAVDKFVFWSNQKKHFPLCFNVSSEQLNTAQLKLIGQRKAHFIQKYKLTEIADELEIGSVEGFIHILLKFKNSRVFSVQYIARYYG
mgnify:FL=1